MHGLEAHLSSSLGSSATAFGLDGREHGAPPAVLPSVENRGTPLIALDGPSTASSQHESVRVLIADDSATTRRFLRGVLEHAHQFDVAGEAADGDAAVAMARKLQPDVVLLDLAMPHVHGTSALERNPHGRTGCHGNRRIRHGPVPGGTCARGGRHRLCAQGIAPFDFLERLGGILKLSLSSENLADFDANS